MMILLIGFVIACASLFLTKKYWAAFFLGWAIFLVIYLAFLENPDKVRLPPIYGYDQGKKRIKQIEDEEAERKAVLAERKKQRDDAKRVRDLQKAEDAKEKRLQKATNRDRTKNIRSRKVVPPQQNLNDFRNDEDDEMGILFPPSVVEREPAQEFVDERAPAARDAPEDDEDESFNEPNLQPAKSSEIRKGKVASEALREAAIRLRNRQQLTKDLRDRLV